MATRDAAAAPTRWVESASWSRRSPSFRLRRQIRHLLTRPPSLSTKGALPGTMVTVLDKLTPQKLVQGKVEEPAHRAWSRTGRAGCRRARSGRAASLLHRDWVQRSGTPGTARHRRGVPARRAPEPPAFVSARYSETTVVVEWPPSGGIVGFLFDSALPPEDPPLDEVLEPIVTATGGGGRERSRVRSDGPPVPGPVKYNLYRELAPDPLALPDPTGPAPWARTPPMPINPAPLSTTTFTDSVEFDRERCYVVRAVRGTPPNVDRRRSVGAKLFHASRHLSASGAGTTRCGGRCGGHQSHLGAEC